MTDREKTVMSCAACGSASIAREAWATWDVSQQRWVLGELFDHVFCHACHRRVTIEEQPVPAG